MRCDKFSAVVFILLVVFLSSLVTKTNLAVHEDKNRVPYVKVIYHNPMFGETVLKLSINPNDVCAVRAAPNASCPVRKRSWTSSTRESPIATSPSPVSLELKNMSRNIFIFI